MKTGSGFVRKFRCSPADLSLTVPILILIAALSGCATQPAKGVSGDAKQTIPGSALYSTTTTTTTITRSTTTTTIRTPTTVAVPVRPYASSPTASSTTGSKKPWRLDPLPEAVALSRETRLPDTEILLRSALAFSGLEGNKLAERTARILTIARSEAGKVAGLVNPAAKAEKLLVAMHDIYLRKYSVHQSSLDLAFSTGEFNCVSSAVMFLVFARAAALEVSGISTVDHAFCLLAVPGGGIDVETTNRYGFNPGSKKEFTDSFGATTGFAYVPQKNYSGRTIISAKRLVTLILANRIAEADRIDRFLPSAGSGVDYYVSEMDNDAKSFMFTRFGNAAGELSNSGDYRTALEFVDEARSKFGDDPGFDRASRIVVDNLLGQLGKNGDWKAGLELLKANPALFEKGTKSANFVRVATHNQVLALTEDEDFAAARSLIASRVAGGLVPVSERRRYDDIIGKALYNRSWDANEYAAGMADLAASETVAAVSATDRGNAQFFLAAREAERLSKSKSALQAWRFLSQAGLPDTEKSRNLFSIYRSNAVGAEHNRFVALYNAQKLQEARDSILASLRVFPGEPLLVKDLDLLKGVPGLR